MGHKKTRNRLKSLPEKIYNYVSDKEYTPISPSELQKALKISKKEYKEFNEALSALLEKNSLKIEKGVIFSAKEEALIATGTIRVHHRGFGFLVPDDRTAFPVDIFVPKHLTGGAVDGDRVEVTVDTKAQSEKGPEGKVTAILERGHSHVAGIILEVLPEGGGIAYVPLLGPTHRLRLDIPKKHTFQVGDRLVIKVHEWGSERRESTGEMHSYLGHISNPQCDIPAAIEEFELHEKFPLQVMQEVEEFGAQVRKKELEGREDLREWECFTIDPDTAKDYDDALSLSKDEKGYYHLGVHIADVSHYVKPETALDLEAQMRCNSVYFPGYVVPMLPHELSSHLCSLKPNVNRLAVSIFMTFDEEGTLLNSRVARSVIRSVKRFTYKEAMAILEGQLKSPHKNTLFLMVDLCHRLKKKRFERGSIEFSLPDTQVYINKEGIPEKIEIVSYDITHQLVEEFMLKANEVVATTLAKQGKPLTYRVHDMPSDENMKDFARLANCFGFALSDAPTAEELQKLFDEARESPFGQFLATAFIRSMRLAVYSTDNIGHYGLGLEYYTHFTSPIRRYVDLIVHRVLLGEIEPELDLEAVALRCSERERLSAKAENSVVSLKKLRLLNQIRKDHPLHIFEGMITSVKPFGFFFEVVGFMMEGFIPISEIGEDFYVFDEGKRCLSGSRTKVLYRLGDRIEVQLKHINFILQETKWSLVSKEVANESSQRRSSQKRGPRRKQRKHHG